MASREPEPANRAAYDRLRLQLVEAGFEPVSNCKGCWEGPLFDCFRPIAHGVEAMRIRIRDGFPYTFPKVYVEGIVSEHVAASHEICLWQTGEDSWSWLTLDDIRKRCEEWVEAHAKGFGPHDEALDAHLYFERTHPGLAILSLSSLRINGQEQTDDLYGSWDEEGTTLSLTRKRPNSQALEGRFYFHPSGVRVPPRDLDAFREALSPRQRRNFDRRLANVRDGAKLVVGLFWDTAFGHRNALVLLLSREADGRVRAEAIEIAPTDNEYRLLRAGPDADKLRDEKVVIFGVGAVGSHIALTLAQCGLGHIHLVDGDEVRPANLTRFRGLPFPGWPKAKAVEQAITFHAPWCDVQMTSESPIAPSRIRELIGNADLVVDATGLARITELLSLEAEKAEVPLVSAALYRQGAIGRVRRQAESDTAIYARTDLSRYPPIPADPERPRRLEPGCSEPVNNASPVAVLRVAAEATGTAIEVLTRRVEGPDELIEVYTPLENAPFDKVGVVAMSL